ncbi:hypothetical protein [Polyangium spumosum]|uniref:Uncharacterized protein n=1 Tax=Polyangium spumosum TaxID=889282 RepID=A0A6N7PX36_9BACT|nr:hypothetical protein [Polyangium spumosum]MRG94805.1 hypothetical protein [Polyangium spumosum]
MSPHDKIDKTDKTDLGSKVDTLLGSWPAPSMDDAAWEERSASIVAAAQAAPRADDAALSALLAPPVLSPEEGEAERSIASEGPARPVVASGEKKMSQDSNSGSSAKPPESMPTSAATSKRPSLKELAARASQAGASRASIPGPSSIPPAAISKPPSEAPPAPVTRTPLPSAPPPKASEAGKEDSGVVDLNLINKTATAEQIAAAEKAKPATHDLAFDGDEKAAAASGKVTSLAEAREKKAEKKGGGATWGILVAVVGIAAAVAIVMRGQGSKENTQAANVGQEKPAVAAEAPKAVEQKIAEAPPPAPTGLSVDSLPTEPSPSDAQKAAQPTAGAAGEDPGKVAAATPTPAAADTQKALTGPAPTIGAKPGDLAGAMAQAVGGSTETNDEPKDAVPAAGNNKGNQTIPEQPSQGSVASAVGSVMGGAKACVAGADDVSRAQITFSSSGSVSNVSVTGWAASNGQSGCVKSALKGANVGAFSKPSFTVGVTIRP